MNRNQPPIHEIKIQEFQQSETSKLATVVEKSTDPLALMLLKPPSELGAGLVEGVLRAALKGVKWKSEGNCSSSKDQGTICAAASQSGLSYTSLSGMLEVVGTLVVLLSAKVFSQLYSLQLEEDVNEVVFALKSDSFTQEDDISEAAVQLKGMLKLDNSDTIQRILDTAKKIKRLK
ncbi:hypothetical protein Droror1_Dr00016381 [Drosera rotundifolia]